MFRRRLDGEADADPMLQMTGGAEPRYEPPAPDPESGLTFGVDAIAPPYTDPSLGSFWHLGSGVGGINVQSVWAKYTGLGVKVALGDEPIHFSHPDLAGAFDTSIDRDFWNGDDDPTASPGTSSHGTWVAGFIGARVNNGVLGSGVAPQSTLVSYQFGQPGVGFSGSFFDDALLRMASDNVAVMNNSWGPVLNLGLLFTDPSAQPGNAMYAAAQDAVANQRGGLGAVIVFSAGNDGDLGDDTNTNGLRAMQWVITVGATDVNGNRASFTTPGATVLVSAPGVNVTTTDQTSGSAAVNGTSFSAPIVSGVVALMLEANPNLAYRDVQEILALSARQTGSIADYQTNGAVNWNGGGMYVSDWYGYGLVDAAAAVRLAETWTQQQTFANMAMINAGTVSPFTGIPDGFGSVSRGFTVGGSLSVEHVEVDLNISHTWVGDLIVRLTSPTGTVSNLVYRPGVYSGNTFGSAKDNIVFTVGSVQFLNEEAQGVWTITVSDVESSFTGTFNTATLRIYGDAPTVNDTYYYTDQLSVFVGEAGRASLTDLDGGVDAVNAAALSTAALIDLAGGVSQIDGQSVTIAGGVIENAIGGAGADTILGNALANGLNGADGNDSLQGADGDDSLASGAGADTVDGGTGSDWADYGRSRSGVSVNLQTNANAGGDAAGDSLVAIENVLGSAANDSLSGNGGDNILSGAGGNDALDGGGGNDTLRGGTGGDTLNGNTGVDLADYSGAASGVQVNLATGVNTGDAAGDSIVGIENVLGSAFSDTLTGDGAANSLDGAVGDDTLQGGAGADTLNGNAGVDAASYAGSAAGVSVSLSGGPGVGGDAAGDSLIGIENIGGSASGDFLAGDGATNSLDGAGGNDTLAGGAGGDTLNGNAGLDTADYSASGAAVSIDLAGNANGGGDAAGDSLIGIEIVAGSGFGDVLRGDAAANLLDGGGGNDTLIGNLGADTLNGGSGAGDLASYAGSLFGVTVNLGTGVNLGGDAAGDSLGGIEQLLGSAGADALTGDGFANTITGGGGDDTIAGAGGADSLDGGAGVNALSYAGASTGVSFDLAIGAGSGGDAVGDVVVLGSFRDLIGSANADLLLGDAQANAITGGGGADSLDGATADDTLVGGGGGDSLNGGAGLDATSYAGSTAAVSVDLLNNTNSGGDAAGDTLISIEKVIGSGLGDSLTGSGADNVLDGAGGNDAIQGGDGADTLAGGAGADTVSGGDANDVVDGGAGADVLDGGAGLVDRLSYIAALAGVTVNMISGFGSGGDAEGDFYVDASFEVIDGSAWTDLLFSDQTAQFVFGGGGIDSIYGFGGADILVGDGGNDLIDGGAGADFIDGDAGADVADYRSSTGGVSVSLITGLGDGGDAAGDTVNSIEILFGSNFADSLTGQAGANTALVGGAGADTLTGGAAIDELLGGGDGDSLTGGAGDDVAYGEDGNDTISGGDGFDYGFGGAGDDWIDVGETPSVNVALGEAGADTLVGGGGVDILLGGNENDSIQGGSGQDYLLGEAGNDTIRGGDGIDLQIDGGAGDDSLDGGGDTDFLFGGAGADTMDGGDGIDLASYAGSTAAVTVDLAGGVSSGGDAAGDSLISIENIAGSGFADLLLGNAAANYLDGGAGDDSLIGGAGADTLIGSTGNDTASYAAAAAGVTVDLQSNINAGGDAAGDSLTSIETLIGSAFGDSLAGDGQGNLLIGGAGADTLDGRAGNDTVTYAASSLGVVINLQTNANAGGDAEGDSLVGIETVIGSVLADAITGDGQANLFHGALGADTLDGGGGNDSLFGGDGADRLLGQAGADVLDGGDGDDTLAGGAGADTFLGGAGNDALSYADAGGSVFVYLDLGVGGLVGSESEGDVYLDSFAVVQGSNFADTIYGAGGVTSIYGGGGSDRFFGTAGGDTFYGGDQDDSFFGAAGNDLFDGGAGTDMIDYSTLSNGITADLRIQVVSGTGATGDTIIGVDGIWATAFADFLTGNASEKSVFRAGEGNDTLIGGTAGDELYGEGGDDSIVGGGGADTIYAGGGIDTLSFADSSVGVNAAFTQSGSFFDPQGRYISGVDVMIGSAFNDTLAGDDLASTLRGGGGNDSISGLGDIDRLEGEAGNDTLIGGDGNDFILGGAGGDSMNGGAGTDTFEFVSGSGADTIGGYASADLIRVQAHVNGTTIASAVDLFLRTTYSGGDAFVDLGGGNIITLTGVAPGGVSFSSFVVF